MTRLATVDDIPAINKLLERYFISSSVIETLCDNNSCVLNETSNGITGVCLLASALNKDGSGTMAKVIGLWGNKSQDAIALVIHVSNIFCEVYYSKEVMKYINLPTGDAKWYTIDMELRPFKNKVYVDKSTFSSDFIKIAEESKLISGYIEGLDKSRDVWLDDKASADISRLLGTGIKEHAYGVYSFPFLSRLTCNSILRKSSKYDYMVNSGEKSLYQMPEVVLSEQDEELYYKLLEVFNTDIAPISNILYNSISKEIRSIQLAKYTAEDINEGNWHKDEDSDITLVVALSDTHKGGGTKIKPYGVSEEITVESLKAGEALLFRGKHYLHKGLQVTEGTRNILVFWTMS